MIRRMILLSLLFASIGSSLALAQIQTALPIAWLPPVGVVAVSPCIPGEGTHYAVPSKLPLGPIYVVRGTRLLAIEYMISQADFAAGREFNDLKFLYANRELPVQHMDIDFNPQGHEGFLAPHFDLHFWFVTHAQHASSTCP